MLSVVMRSVVMPSVVAPFKGEDRLPERRSDQDLDNLQPLFSSLLMRKMCVCVCVCVCERERERERERETIQWRLIGLLLIHPRTLNDNNPT